MFVWRKIKLCGSLAGSSAYRSAASPAFRSAAAEIWIVVIFQSKWLSIMLIIFNIFPFDNLFEGFAIFIRLQIKIR